MIVKKFLILFMLLTGCLEECAFTQIINSKTKFGDNKAAGNFMNLRGFNMYYEVYGKGEPLLMIHGNGGSVKAFVNQIPYFSKKFQVIIADSRAQGKSVDSKDSLTYEMMADDLDALLDGLHLKQAYVIGWSDGGINGLLLAIRHPDKVKKLAITGANLWPDTTAVEPFVVEMSIAASDSLSKVQHKSPETKNLLKLANLLSYQPNIKLTDLRKIACPSLIIGGDHDVILPQHTMAIAKGIRNSYLWIVPNSGHATPFSKKDQFNTVIYEFFKQPLRIFHGMQFFE